MSKWNWKKAFFLLLFINILILITFSVIIFISPDNRSFTIQKQEQIGEPVFHLQTTKEELNGFINHYLEKELGDSPIDYTVLLTEQVELIGQLPVFDRKVQMTLTFVPEALENGDILLTQKSIRIGQLNLPVTYVMNVVNKSYKFPEWVELYPNERVIYIHLTKMKLKNDLRIMAKTIDLENDLLEFSVRLDDQ
ncbi:YpmS family protein [Fervidibacillus halotolerans]|uniref:YpmS family protein n=1 Tax=Fervidibacillus halotolerans TaxID=2980027 RepID=A0A9E8M1K7_9BACI|nr:YpmS family protein [Fervidibacillus halotolerans]WAA13282.1 YpmS family protein [Fervidibacillus halotolerans]